jgi:hypothetical protein
MGFLNSNCSRLSILTLTALTLSACGGGGTDAFIENLNSPGGQYFGYYVETDDNKDPAVGALYLDIPNKEGDVKGRMSFQYVDCQRTNALEIKAKKATREITLGTASGTIDSPPTPLFNNLVNFSFIGDYKNSTMTYNGKYNLLDGATTNRVETDCNPDFSYTLSPKGNWTVYPITHKFPDSFTVNINSDLLSWTNAPSNASTALISIIDPTALGTSSNNGFVFQRLLKPIVLQSTSIAALNAGKQYIALIQLFDANNNIVAFQARVFTR